MNQKDHYVEKKIKIKKIVGLLIDVLGGKIMTEFAAFRPKRSNYLKDDNDENKKARGTRKCVIKQKFQFEDYKNCLEANQLEIEINTQKKNKLDTYSLRQTHKKLIKKTID